MSVRLTRRGWGLLGIVGFCLLMAAQFGSRALNAVVAPLALVLLAGLITTYRTDRPVLTRRPIEEGYPGDRRSVELVADVDSPLAVTVHDPLPSGVRSVDGENSLETTLVDGSTLEYEIELERRGVHVIGPLSVQVTDIFGLVSREFEYARTTEVLTYPAVYDLRGGAKHDLQLLRDAVGRYDREEFDHLREYARGDSLRDIHWKSAAKRPDDELVVKEFVADTSVGSVTVAGECIPGREDELASAVASVATYLLREEVAVGVTLPGEGLEARSDAGHHREILRTLAAFDAGALDDRARADVDVVVQADATSVVVLVDGHELPFDRLAGGHGRGNSPSSPSGGRGSTASDTDAAPPSGSDGSRPSSVGGDRSDADSGVSVGP